MAGSTPAAIKLNENGIPNFDALPLRPGDPKYSAWGLYGEKDELGTLNRLTDERVAEAAKNEIKIGVRISLNWPLNAQAQAPKKDKDSDKDSGSVGFFNRKLFHQDLFAKHPRCVNDDVWTFNSQVSSQWDGLRHYAYQKERLFYNGVTMEIHGHEDGDGGGGSGRGGVNGVQAWPKKGIVGRGVLVDFHSWRLKVIQEQPDLDPALTRRLVDFDHFATTPILLGDILACLEYQGTEVKFGDVLFVRSGWIHQHQSLPPSALASQQKVNPPSFCGLEPSIPLFNYLWKNLSAVAGDQPSLECWPPAATLDPINFGDELSLHEVMLAGWGMPIGELFDLEELARECKEQKRWSFFLTSEVCNVKGGVASPPNALAIF